MLGQAWRAHAKTAFILSLPCQIYKEKERQEECRQRRRRKRIVQASSFSVFSRPFCAVRLCQGNADGGRCQRQALFFFLFFCTSPSIFISVFYDSLPYLFPKHSFYFWWLLTEWNSKQQRSSPATGQPVLMSTPQPHWQLFTSLLCSPVTKNLHCSSSQVAFWRCGDGLNQQPLHFVPWQCVSFTQLILVFPAASFFKGSKIPQIFLLFPCWNWSQQPQGCDAIAALREGGPQYCEWEGRCLWVSLSINACCLCSRKSWEHLH